MTKQTIKKMSIAYRFWLEEGVELSSIVHGFPAASPRFNSHHLKFKKTQAVIIWNDWDIREALLAHTESTLLDRQIVCVLHIPKMNRDFPVFYEFIVFLLTLN